MRVDPGADAHCERVLAGIGVARNVAQVVDHQQRGGPQAHRHAGHERQGLDLFEEDVGGADRGNHTEKHENEDLAETEIAVRLRPPV